MKKLIKILGLLFLSMTILFSCGEDAKFDKESDKDKKKDKYKKEIKDPCDILDYTIEIFENLSKVSALKADGFHRTQAQKLEGYSMRAGRQSYRERRPG